MAKVKTTAPAGPENREMDKGNSARIKIDVMNGVLPLGIGIEIPGGRTYEIIESGTKLPIHRSEVFSTTESGQMAADFNVLFGGRPLSKDNISLCRIRVRNVKYGGAGTAKINISFDISHKGIMTVRTRNLDRAQNRDVALVSVTNDHISREDINWQLADLKAHEEEDARIRQSIKDMLSGYQLMSDTYEVYAIAKKRMSFIQKQSYRSARKRLGKALQVMPPDATTETDKELRKALDELQAQLAQLEEHKKHVEQWWEEQRSNGGGRPKSKLRA